MNSIEMKLFMFIINTEDVASYFIASKGSSLLGLLVCYDGFVVGVAYFD